MHRWGGSQAFPSVITVFSAPNYCGTYSNKGAVILIENDKMNIKQYKDVDHPFHLPGDIDLFTWSIPFLAEKVTEMLFAIVGQNNNYSPKSAKDLEKIDFTQLLKDPSKEHDKKEILRTKVMAVARLQRLFKNLRSNSEMLIAIKKQASDGKIPRGLLLSGTPAIKNAFQEFNVSKMLDKDNEKHPVASG
jgi:serine/threonine-protein phosphatase 2B catalytic subunit